MNTAESASLNIESASSGTSSWRDWLGVVASVGCAIHCAAMPFVFAYLPALGLSFLADEAFHKWMALVCFLIAIVAFVPGIRKHKNWTPLSVAVVGLTLITYAAFGLAGECCASCSSKESAELVVTAEADCAHCTECESCKSSSCKSSATASVTAIAQQTTPKKSGLLSILAPWITPVGGVMLVGAHLLNRRYGCLCGCCGPDTSPST